MIDDLIKIELDAVVIEDIMHSMDYNDLLNLTCHYETINKNIALLKSYGFENIDTLFKNRSNLFIEDTEVIKKKLDYLDMPTFVSLVNEDYTVIDEVF